ncbi:MAG: SPFH domain-containing protein [Tannerellaceae bacterium]|jgi:membrane protease subunit (stomatin/prohibitin family)|nr:SPFH domain-containing protein [Tannerellaceae bacterium]
MAGITQIITYEGDRDTFLWKHPAVDFATWSQLIVHESQEAIFFLNGQALDLFGPGRHTLDVPNIPLIHKILNKPTGNQTPFHCEVYFINKTEQPAIKWGTDSRIQYLEPTYRFPLHIGASGEMSLRVEDSRKLLVKITGTEKSFDHAGLVRIFRAFLQTRIKPYLARIMQEGKVSIFETDIHLGELSETLHTQLLGDFADYGLRLERFFVTTIAKPDGDRAYEKFKEIHLRQYADVAEAQIRQKVDVIEQQTQAQKMVIEAEALAEKRKREGFTYQQERSFDVAEKVAQNEAVGNYSNLGIGLGLMGGVAAGMGATVAGITSEALHPTATAPEQNPFATKVEKLKIMKNAGLLSAEEFEQEKKKLLDTL